MLKKISFELKSPYFFAVWDNKLNLMHLLWFILCEKKIESSLFSVILELTVKFVLKRSALFMKDIYYFMKKEILSVANQ